MTKITGTPPANALSLADLMFVAQGSDVVEHATVEQLVALLRASATDQKTAPPLASDFDSIVNGGNGNGNVLTLTQKPGAVQFDMAGLTHATATGYRATMAGPGTPTFKVSARIGIGMPNVAHFHFGLCIYDPALNKLVTFGHTGGVGLEFNGWTDDGNTVGFIGNVGVSPNVGQEASFWAQLVRNADGSITANTSQDGESWFPVATSQYLAANADPATLRIGFYTVDEFDAGPQLTKISNRVYYFEADNYAKKNYLYNPASIGYPNVPFVYTVVPINDLAQHNLTKGDAGKFFDCAVGAGFRFQDDGPTSSTGATMVFGQSGPNPLSLTAAAGLTLRVAANYQATTKNQGDVLVAVKTGAQTWTLYGDTAAGQGVPAAAVWGIRLQTSNDPSYCSLFEIEFRSVAGVSETANGGVAHCDRSYFSMADVNALFDGNKTGGMRFASGQPYTGNRIWYVFPAVKQVNEVAVYTYSGGEHPTGFDIIYSTDGGNTFTTLNQVRNLDPGQYPVGTPILVEVAVPPPVVVPPTATVLTDPGDAISPAAGDRWIIGNGAHAYFLQSDTEAGGADDAVGIGCTVTFIQNDANVSSWAWSAGDSVSCIRPAGRGVENLGQGSVVVARYIGVRRWSITGDLGT